METFRIPGGIKPRAGYLARIRPFVGKQIIKVLTGQRRVGKSYLLFQIMAEIRRTDKNAHIIYVNKEDFAFDFIRDAGDLHSYVSSRIKPGVKNHVFIDEIQEIAAFEKTLRSLLLDENNDIYITGSNARMLSGELATHLSGRHVEFTVYSLSYPEFLMFHQLEDSDDSLMLFLKFGGLPWLANLPLGEPAFDYLKGIYSTIVFRDVISRHQVRNAVFLEKLIQFLADNTGSLFSAKRISDFLKSQRTNIAPNQIQLYTQHLASAFLIHRVPRYDIAGRRIFEVGEKFYFENLGIRNSTIGFKPADMGKVLENAVCNHLLYLGYDVKIGMLDSGEIDFVCERGGEIAYVQAALRIDGAKTFEREFGNLLKIKDNYPKLVVTQDRPTGGTHEGVRHAHIREFLLATEVT
ncbi:putative ATPase (AAA+ superfamily) [Opitutaceae bacterium TAV1]|nr:putative ATPase (AAA+ superfamily) [Opitutaceae bacterium TAV1]